MISSVLKNLIAIALFLAVGACATNPFEKHYTDVSSARDGPVGFMPYKGKPRAIASSGDPNQDIERMYENGYGLIGHSSFSGRARKPRERAVKQAKKVGAAVVIVSVKYKTTKSGVIPFTTPTTTTSYSSGTASVYGGYGGYASGSYSGTTTHYGSQTNYIPYSVDHYDQWALFFAPLERKGLGISFGRMTDEQRRMAGTNKGLRLVTVRKGSPAFMADFLPGDVLLSIGGKMTFDANSVHKAVSAAWGHETQVVINRLGRKIVKNIMIPYGTW